MEMARLSADRVLLLGPLQVIQNGVPLQQPPSRKVRALLGYLAMAPRPVTAKSSASCFGTSRTTREASCAGAFPSYARSSTGRRRRPVCRAMYAEDAGGLFTKGASVAIGLVQGRLSRRPFGRRGSIVRKLARRPATPLRSVAPSASRTAELRPAAGER